MENSKKEPVIVQLTEDSKSSKIEVWIPIIISVLAVLFSALTYCKLISSNRTNYEAKAKAGDIDAQIFLADCNLDVGEYKQSIYWYQVALKDERIPNNLIAKCKNNIAYILIKNPELLTWNSDYFSQILDYLRAAEELDSTEAWRNEYIFLLSYPSDVISTMYDYDNRLHTIKEKLERSGDYDEDIASYSSSWEKTILIEDPTEIEAVLSGIEGAYIAQPAGYKTIHYANGGVQVVPIIQVYERRSGTETPPYTRIK